ncbi:MAG: rfaE bifunctional protein kinase chain/domain [Candidatus Paceibacteria bacterium]|jgi:rfaE bifunctional protein kinase chain/domain
MSLTRLPKFQNLRVAVAGDLVADHYLNAEPRRLSREAPVMVLRYRSESVGAGGAANVARNLRGLEGQVSVFGLVGRDSYGRELTRTLEAEKIDLAGLQSEPGWCTPTKTRVLAAEARRFPQQVLRIDREPDEPAPRRCREAVAKALMDQMEQLDALVVSDYEYGIVGDELAEVARAFAGAGKTVVLDPRRRLAGFRGITAITPNMGELAVLTGVPVEDLEDVTRLRKAASELLERVGSRYLLVTRGNMGMALFGEDLDPKGLAVEASGQGEVTDVSGAGDSAASVFALALAAGVSPAEAMQLANTASGVVVMENGTAVCTRIELEQALAASPAPTLLQRPSF